MELASLPAEGVSACWNTLKLHKAIRQQEEKAWLPRPGVTIVT